MEGYDWLNTLPIPTNIKELKDSFYKLCDEYAGDLEFFCFADSELSSTKAIAIRLCLRSHDIQILNTVSLLIDRWLKPLRHSAHNYDTAKGQESDFPELSSIATSSLIVLGSTSSVNPDSEEMLLSEAQIEMEPAYWEPIEEEEALKLTDVHEPLDFRYGRTYTVYLSRG